jgi:hypothetical protein
MVGKTMARFAGQPFKTAFHAYLYEKTVELSLPVGLLPVRALC